MDRQRTGGFIASDVPAPGEYLQGLLSDLHIRGKDTQPQTGIYVGGDAACTGSCTSNPATNVGYDYAFQNITVLNMGGNGIQYGNSAFNLLWDTPTTIAVMVSMCLIPQLVAASATHGLIRN